jgi:uncharacterized protein (TIGR03086 family)
MDLWELTRRAHQDTTKIIGRLTAEDWDRPTPCSEWTVRDVVEHLIDNNDRFAALAVGRPQHRSGSYEESSAEFLDAFDAEARSKALDFRQFGVLPGRIGLGVLFVDVLVHAWDIDTALGREHHWDDELATAALGFASRYPDVAPVRGPGGAFADAVDVPSGARPGDRLIALLGRPIA